MPKPPPRKVYADDFTDADIERFHQETVSGKGGELPPGKLRDFLKPQYDFIFEQMRMQTWTTYGGIKGETLDDGRGWVWLVADGRALQIYKSIPYGRSPLMVGKKDDIDGMLAKADWAKVEERLEVTLGTQVGIEEREEWSNPKSFEPFESVSSPPSSPAPEADAEKPAAPAAAAEPAAAVAAAAEPAAAPAAVAEPAAAVAAAPKVDASTMTVPQMRRKLTELGLDSAGTRQQLVERLSSA